MKKQTPYSIFTAAVSLLLAMPIHAQIPNLINYQGRLADAQGNPVSGNRTMAVRVYDAPTGGNMTYEETIGTVAVANGTYSFRFGSGGLVPVTASETVATTNGTHQVFSGAIQGTPHGGGITLSDGTYSWTPAGGSSNPAAFSVTYNANLRSFQIVYLSELPSPGRAIVASFQRLQAQNSIEAALANPEAHLALVVNSVEETKRSRLLAVPYALRAKSSQTSADAQAILSGSLALPSGSVGSTQLSSNAVQSRHLAEGSVDSSSLAPGAFPAHQVASGNITAEPNKTYFVNTAQESGTVLLPQNPQPGDVVRVVGGGALVRAPEGAAILHGWTQRKLETSTENASSIYQVFCSDDANTIYAAISARSKDDQSWTDRQTIAISRDGAKTWTFLSNSTVNNSPTTNFLHGCSGNGSRLLCSVNSSLKILDNFGGNQTNIALPDGVASFDFVRLTPDGNRIVGFHGPGQSIYVSDNLGQNWRKCGALAGGEEIQFPSTGTAPPFQTNANGSVILAQAQKVSGSGEALVYSEDAGASWRILQLPLVNGMELAFYGLITSLSKDGNRIFIWKDFHVPPTMASARLVSYDKGMNWSFNQIQYAPDESPLSGAAGEHTQILQSASSGSFYFGQIKSSDSGASWTNLPQIYTGMPTGEVPRVQAISSSGAKAISGTGSMGGSGQAFFTSWREEMRCTKSLEFFYTGEGVWDVVSN